MVERGTEAGRAEQRVGMGEMVKVICCRSSTGREEEPGSIDYGREALEGVTVVIPSMTCPKGFLPSLWPSIFPSWTLETLVIPVTVKALSQSNNNVWQPLLLFGLLIPFSLGEHLSDGFNGGNPSPLVSHGSRQALCESESFHHETDQPLPSQLIGPMMGPQSMQERLEGTVILLRPTQKAYSFSRLPQRASEAIIHPTEIRTSIFPCLVVWLNTTGALANFATAAGFDQTEKRASERTSDWVARLASERASDWVVRLASERASDWVVRLASERASDWLLGKPINLCILKKRQTHRLPQDKFLTAKHQLLMNQLIQTILKFYQMDFLSINI
uniref:Uncharacterized protein n=1 Tax=Timema bartmani TaxID=61472 RepID=A0A7R9HYP3_9NEOP|nr:unnamed protein product [Timema bartmani]